MISIAFPALPIHQQPVSVPPRPTVRGKALVVDSDTAFLAFAAEPADRSLVAGLVA